jgi:hypothetical protein
VIGGTPELEEIYAHPEELGYLVEFSVTCVGPSKISFDDYDNTIGFWHLQDEVCMM